MLPNAGANQATTFAITDTKPNVTVVTLPTQDNVKLLQKLKSGFKRTINLNKYHPKPEPLNALGPYLNFLIKPSFQCANRLFVLPLNANDSRILHSRCYLPTAKVKDYNIMIDTKIFFDQPMNNYITTYENIRKIRIGQGDDYTTGCLLDYNYFKEHYNMMATDLCKQQELDADQKSIQQINFTGNLDGANNRIMFFITEEVKETILDISQGILKVLWMSSYNLLCIAEVSNSKVFDCTAC